MIPRRHTGFTLVEIMVAIVVLAILFGIIVLGYSTWHQKTAATAVQNDLTAAATAMKNARTWDNGYPSTIPSSSFTESKNVTVTLDASSDADHYCLKGVSNDVSSVVFYVTDSDSTPHTGGC